MQTIFPIVLMKYAQIHDPYGFAAGDEMTEAIVAGFRSDEVVEQGLRDTLRMDETITLKESAAGTRHQVSILLHKHLITEEEAEEFDLRIITAWEKLQAERGARQ